MGRLARSPRKRRRDESGVVAVVVAIITCFTLIPLAAYAVDIGVQRVARRDAQSVADLVALDLTRQLDGRTYAQIMPTLPALADKSAVRNSTGGSPFTVTTELGTLDEGHFDPQNPDAYFMKTTVGTVVPTALRVTAKAVVGFSFIAGEGSVTRTAVATTRAMACFKMGSYAATVSSGNSALLNGLIGDALNLGVLSYDGLANANVTLLGLATELGAGTTDQLLALDDLSLNQLYLASAKVLQKQGGDAADIALLNSLATANFGSLPHIAFGDMIGLGAGDDAALASTVNLFDLVTGSAFLANGTNALAIPNLTVGVPNVASVTASLKVIEGKSLCSTTTAKTDQVSFDVTFNINNLSALGILGLASSNTKLTVHVSLANATGTLTKVLCGTPEGIDVSVVSALSSLSATFTTDLRLLGIPLASVSTTAASSAPTTSTTVSIRIPPDALNSPKSAGSGTVVPNLTITSGDLTLLGVLSLPGGLIGALTSSLMTPIINPLINNVNSILIGPLANLLGLKLAGADVFLPNHPICNGRALAG